MTQQELIEFLRDKLSVSIEIKHGYYGNPDYVEVALLLDGEAFSESSFNLPSKD